MPRIVDVRAIDDVRHMEASPLNRRRAVTDVELAHANVAERGLPRQERRSTCGRRVRRDFTTER